MRIRSVRPDFWQDDTLGHLSDAARLFYIGLWCVADDAGWLEWKPAQIGAALYPYRNAAARVRSIEGWGETLVDAGRVVRYPCGCAHIPTLPKHQRTGGNPSYQYRDKHRYHTSTEQSGQVRRDTPQEEGEGERGEGGRGSARARDAAPRGDWEAKVVAMQRRGEGR